MPLDRQLFGKKLSAERKRLNLQVDEVADSCGIKPGTQYLYEQGKRVPNAEYLEMLFEMGFRPYVLLPSVSLLSEAIDIEKIRKAFIETDFQCRDSKGRLLDLENRLSNFIDKLTEA